MFTEGDLSMVGGALALEFANTAAGRGTPTPSDHLDRAADLIDWAGKAGHLDVEVMRRCRAMIDEDSAMADAMLRCALQLREAIYRIGAALAHGDVPARQDLSDLKDFARRALGAATLEPADDHYRFDFSKAPPEIALLAPIAWTAIDMLSTGRFKRLKQCANPDCGWLFLDNSKNYSRRWCDMATCGNVAKGRRHRQRRA